MGLAPVIRGLPDTGPLVACLDPRDPAHGSVVEPVDPCTGQLAPIGAVTTEAMHFMGQAPKGPHLLTELITVSRTGIYDFSRPPELRAATALMETYGDTPMVLADATLSLLADRLGVDEVLTLDRRGFSACRTRGGRPLRLVVDLT